MTYHCIEESVLIPSGPPEIPRMWLVRTVNVEIQTVVTMNVVEERSFNPHGGRLFYGIASEVKHTLMPARLRLELEGRQ